MMEVIILIYAGISQVFSNIYNSLDTWTRRERGFLGCYQHSDRPVGRRT